MLMRIFRFLGWIRKVGTAKYILTQRGEAHVNFEGDFQDIKENTNEEEVVLDALKDFAFYSVNDTKEYRDKKFKIRPFIWLLYNLSIEPQCIHQLIVTCFASQNENKKEIKRIKDILNNLKNKKTNLKKEFSKLGLDADDYSCVHNFYDSAKILVYLGGKLGLIDKTTNPKYGKLIAGNAKNLKQASIFYTITEKGKRYLDDNKKTKLIYFEDIEKKADKEDSKMISLILGVLNFNIENKNLNKISKSYLDNLIGRDSNPLLNIIKNDLNI